MKTKLAALAAAVVLATLASAQTGTGKAGDEAAIRKIGERYAAAWNGGNAQEAAAVFAEDGSFTKIDGQTFRGRSTIEQDMASGNFGTAKTGMTMSIDTATIQFVRPDLAVVTGTTHFSGAPEGQRAGHYMSIVRKVGSGWKVAAVHAAAAPPAVMTADRPTGTSGSGADADALIAIEREWGEAMVAKDVPTLSRILADDFTEVDPTGSLRAKDIVLAEAGSGDFKVDSYTARDLKARVYGDTAVVTGVSDLKATFKGEDMSGSYRWTDTFVRRNGRWQAVASQVTRVMQ